MIPDFESVNSGTGREWKNPFPKLGSGKGMKKTYSKNSGTGRALKRSIPKIREREGNDKIKFPHFGNGNRKLSFPGRARNVNENRKKKQMI